MARSDERLAIYNLIMFQTERLVHSPINLVYHHTLYYILPSISKETSFPPFPDNHPRLTWAKWQYCCLPRQIRTLRIGRGADNVSKCDTNWRHPLLLKNREQIEKSHLLE